MTSLVHSRRAGTTAAIALRPLGGVLTEPKRVVEKARWRVERATSNHHVRGPSATRLIDAVIARPTLRCRCLIEYPFFHVAGHVRMTPITVAGRLRTNEYHVGHRTIARRRSVGGTRVGSIARGDGCRSRGNRPWVLPLPIRSSTPHRRVCPLRFTRQEPAIPHAEGVRRIPIDAIHWASLVAPGISRPGRKIFIALQDVVCQLNVGHPKPVPSGFVSARATPN